MSERIHYDEFGLFHENIAEYDLGCRRHPMSRASRTRCPTVAG